MRRPEASAAERLWFSSQLQRTGAAQVTDARR